MFYLIFFKQVIMNKLPPPTHAHISSKHIEE